MHLKLFFFILYIFSFFCPEINKPNIHNNINDILSFQNGLNVLLSSTGFYLKSKVVEGSHRGENLFSNFWTLLLKIYIFEIVTFFFLPNGYPINSILQWQYIFTRFVLFMKHFFLYYQNAYDHQPFQGGDMLQGALTHIYPWHHNGVALWCQVTNKIHISTCRRCINTTLAKMIT